jgi:pyruvate/2-oxoglutarate dehydrogenase complex dihydrolipoamide dehydrogenase (E3) component
MRTEAYQDAARNPAPRPLYDWVVVGGGPAGQAAARAAAALGLGVALVERDRLGGNSLNRGTIPSKALVQSGRILDAVVQSREFGARAAADPIADMRMVMQRMRSIRERIAEYWSAERLTAAGVDVFSGCARFTGRRSLEVQDTPLNFRKALIATGARPRFPDIPGLLEAGHLTSATFFSLESLPKRLAIIGGGPLGCEMAQAFAHLGSKVTILQNEPKFLPEEERDAAEILSLALARSGVDTRLNTEVTGARSEHGEKIIDATSAGNAYSIVVDDILLSTGRVAATDGLDLAAAGVEVTDSGDIRIDAMLRTGNPDVFAAGDVCMLRKFTNVAVATGRLAVRNAFGEDPQPHEGLVVPWCTYCDPEVAHVGMHLWDAHRDRIPVESYTVMMQDVDRAITDGRDEGFVKIHVRRGSDRILGATIVAARASEMINEVAVIMQAGMGMCALASVLHAYPAQSDAIRMAAQAFVDKQRVSAA